MDGLIVGRTVHYVLTQDDVDVINARRKAANSFEKKETPWTGIQFYSGNSVEVGEHVPMMIVKVWNKEKGLVNGKCFLDGNDDYWVTSVFPDETNQTGHTWHRVEPA